MADGTVKVADLPPRTQAWLLAVVAALALPLVLWRVWVLATLWGWLVVPLGAPAWGMLELWGLVLVAEYVSPRQDNTEEPTVGQAAKLVAQGFARPMVWLAYGWALHTVAS